MHRRLFVTGLLGVAGTAGLATLLPREALAAVPMGPKPQPNSVLPDLSAPSDAPYEPEVLDELGEQDELEEGVQLAHLRRRRRVRRWRTRCRWRRINGHWRRRCRREPYFLWLWFWI